METVNKNLNSILTNINALCAKNGMDSNAIEIIGASKFRSIETLRELSSGGVVTVFGENKVQEFNSKYDESLTWDIIGQLQTNKVKYVVGKVRYISSLDRIALAEEIEKVATKRDVVQKCLVEVNSGEEENKGGISVDEVESFLEKLSAYPHLKVAEKFEQLKCKYPDFTVLSMGMSEDYLLAIECGSNQVRLGRVLFGDRP